MTFLQTYSLMVEIINLLTNKITTILTTNDIEFKQVLNSHLNSHPNINFRNVALFQTNIFWQDILKLPRGQEQEGGLMN